MVAKLARLELASRYLLHSICFALILDVMHFPPSLINSHPSYDSHKTWKVMANTCVTWIQLKCLVFFLKPLPTVSHGVVWETLKVCTVLCTEAPTSSKWCLIIMNKQNSTNKLTTVFMTKREERVCHPFPTREHARFLTPSALDLWRVFCCTTQEKCFNYTTRMLKFRTKREKGSFAVCLCNR